MARRAQCLLGGLQLLPLRAARVLTWWSSFRPHILLNDQSLGAPTFMRPPAQNLTSSPSAGCELVTAEAKIDLFGVIVK